MRRYDLGGMGVLARTPRQQVKAQRRCSPLFSAFRLLKEFREKAGHNQANLAANGLNVPLTDAIIATAAVDMGLESWTYDAHFTAMARLMSGLKLFHETP